jgi:hypothetical protein
MGRGRSSKLIHLRNKKLVERYYYWSEIKRLRFDDVINILSTQEFFITERTITEVLRNGNDYLNTLITMNPSSGQLSIFPKS